MGDPKDFIRKTLFPDITDWSSDHDELRFYADWPKMKLWYFIFFHWLGTRMFLFFTTVLSTCWCVYGIIYSIQHRNTILGIISSILFFVMVNATYNKMVEWKKKVKWTFYDLFLRKKWN